MYSHESRSNSGHPAGVEHFDICTSAPESDVCFLSDPLEPFLSYSIMQVIIVAISDITLTTSDSIPRFRLTI